MLFIEEGTLVGSKGKKNWTSSPIGNLWINIGIRIKFTSVPVKYTSQLWIGFFF